MKTFSIQFLQTLLTAEFWQLSIRTFARLFAYSFFGVIIVHQIFIYFVRSLSKEARLRLAFIVVPGTLLVTSMVYRAPIFPLAIYAFIGGAFLGILWETRKVFSLIEANATPNQDIIDKVLKQHTHIQLIDPYSFNHILKRFFDRVFSLFFLIILSPILLFVSVIIWLNDPGPIILAKSVTGFGGHTFREYKLRSMIKRAEEKTGAVQSGLHDPRVIWIGKMIRRLHIDEIPQFVNVLRGEMSFVGPRPEKTICVVDFLKEVKGYAKRHSVLPGITGWAQIHHTYYTPRDEKLVFDLHYVEKQNLLFDAWIVLRTIPATLSRPKEKNIHQIQRKGFQKNKSTKEKKS